MILFTVLYTYFKVIFSGCCGKFNLKDEEGKITADSGINLNWNHFLQRLFIGLKGSCWTPKTTNEFAVVQKKRQRKNAVQNFNLPSLSLINFVTVLIISKMHLVLVVPWFFVF